MTVVHRAAHSAKDLLEAELLSNGEIKSQTTAAQNPRRRQKTWPFAGMAS